MPKIGTAYRVVITALILVLGVQSRASATAIMFTGSQGNLAASIGFQSTGNSLTVTLTNTSTADVVDPAGVLTCVFFDINVPGTLTLSPDSAVIGPTSTVLFGTTDPDPM